MWLNLLISDCGASKFLPLLPVCTATCAKYMNRGRSAGCSLINRTASSVNTSVAYLPATSHAIVSFRRMSNPWNSPKFWYYKVIKLPLKMIVCFFFKDAGANLFIRKNFSVWWNSRILVDCFYFKYTGDFYRLYWTLTYKILYFQKLKYLYTEYTCCIWSHILFSIWKIFF